MVNPLSMNILAAQMLPIQSNAIRFGPCTIQVKSKVKIRHMSR